MTFLIAVAWLHQAATVLCGLALTLWLVGDDSWFEGPLPGAGTVFLIAVGAGAAALLSRGVIWHFSSGMPEAERTELRDHTFF